MATAAKLEAAMREHAVEATDIALDLHNVSFMDSAGLRAVLMSQRHCDGNACRLTVEGSAWIYDVFEAYGVRERLPLMEP